MSTRTKDTAAEPEEANGVVDIIASAPGAFEAFGPDLSGLPEGYQDESWLSVLSTATSLEDIPEEFLAALRTLRGSNLIAKEDLVGAPFAIIGYRRTVGNYKHPETREHLSYYTLDVLARGARGKVILSGVGMNPVFETLEQHDIRPPFMVPKGLRRSDDWVKDGEPMNGTWYLG